MVVTWDGSTEMFSTYTESEAFQKANDFAQDRGGIKSFEER